jgi:hypothetical protein
MDDTITLDDAHTVPTRYWHPLDDGRVQCDVCPRACRLHEGQRGLCFVRGRVDHQIVLTSYGRSSGFCWIRWRRSRSTTMMGTPPATLTRARRIALGNGLRYVYTGNVHDIEGGTTTCPGCGAAVVIRDWYAMRRYLLDDDGACRVCGTRLPGVYDGPAGHWCRRRLPVSVARARR